MLKYEWRPCRAIEPDDAALNFEDKKRIDLTLPESTHQDISTAGPNPLQVVNPEPPLLPDPVIQGAENNDQVDHIQNNVLQDSEENDLRPF